MPTHMRASISYQVDSLLPRDAHTINPCFRHSAILPGDDPSWQSLADDLAAAVQSYSTSGTSRQLTVKLYEIKDPVAGQPNRPKATKVLNPAVAAPLTYPGEIALCLSFYGGQNGPHQRGRLYVPVFMINSSGPGGVRPSLADRNRNLGWESRFSALGGPNVDWIVWSQTNKAATQVTNVFCDDEWDVQRRRGLKYTVRTAATTSG